VILAMGRAGSAGAAVPVRAGAGRSGSRMSITPVTI